MLLAGLLFFDAFELWIYMPFSLSLPIKSIPLKVLVVLLAWLFAEFHLRSGKEDAGRMKLGLTIPERGGQTKLSSDQTIFERTLVLGALELHGL